MLVLRYLSHATVAWARGRRDNEHETSQALRGIRIRQGDHPSQSSRAQEDVYLFPLARFWSDGLRTETVEGFEQFAFTRPLPERYQAQRRASGAPPSAHT